MGEANGSKTISDLVSDNINIEWSGTKGTVTGDIKYVSDYSSAYPEDQKTGHFFPIKFEEKYYDKEIQLNSKVITPTSKDPYLITRIENLAAAAAAYRASAGGSKVLTAKVKDTQEVVFELNFDGATLLPITGSDAVTILDGYSFGECGNTSEWYTGLKTTWEGVNCAIEGTFTKGTKSEATGKYQIGLKFNPYFDSMTLQVGDKTWNKDEDTFVGHKGFETTTDTVIDITCEGTTIAHLTFAKATFQ